MIECMVMLSCSIFFIMIFVCILIIRILQLSDFIVNTKQYKIVTTVFTEDKLSENVTKYLEKGWRLYGGLKTIKIKDSNEKDSIELYQVIVK